MKKKDCLVTQQQRKEIFYNIINALLSGVLVFFGTIVGAGFQFTTEGFLVATGVSIIVGVTKFKSYWDGEAGEYVNRSFNFLP